jgi:hypothetical protein
MLSLSPVAAFGKAKLGAGRFVSVSSSRSMSLFYRLSGRKTGFHFGWTLARPWPGNRMNHFHSRQAATAKGNFFVLDHILS